MIAGSMSTFTVPSARQIAMRVSACASARTVPYSQRIGWPLPKTPPRPRPLARESVCTQSDRRDKTMTTHRPIAGRETTMIRLALILLLLSSVAHADGGKIEQLHFILRPNPVGQWYIQNDKDHASIGVQHRVEQTETHLRVRFERKYSHAVVIQITSDDEFGTKVSGHASLGIDAATIFITADGKRINPMDVRKHYTAGGGNLWISVTMLDR
jgi:hypothetical protein